jgi:DNA-directed RNA polymerase specialized sigma24 family protein
MLYEWLAEADERRFDLAFKRYFTEASIQLVRYLARRSSLADLDCEQIAVDALLKFFGRIGRERRVAAGTVGTALADIKPLALDLFHGRQVKRWTGDVAAFRQTTMAFIPPAEAAERPLKPLIQEINDHIPGLRRQGCLVLDGVRGGTKETVSRNATLDFGEDDNASSEEDVLPHYHALRHFASSLRDTHGVALAPEIHLPGLPSFVAGAWTVIEILPVLRVPTNGYLFDIAHSLYLDECKARGRLKRGGSGYSVGEAQRSHPLTMGDEEWPDDDGRDAGSYTLAGDALGQTTEDISLDQIDEDFCEQFYTYLRKPLTDAEEAYRRAAEKGRAEAERQRLESIGRKNERLMTVLTLRVEGHTQEAIAETLGISRNQVKYIVESVQASYEDFCKAAMGAQRA